MATRLCTAIRLRHLLAEFPDPIDNPYVKAVRRWIREASVQLNPEPIAAVNPPDDQPNRKEN
jgi:hypothetical protein